MTDAVGSKTAVAGRYGPGTLLSEPARRSGEGRAPGDAAAWGADCPDVGDDCGSVRMEVEAGKLTPHFLRNSLQAVGFLLDSGRETEAREYLGRLQDLLSRRVAERAPSERPLVEQLGFVRDYVVLEALRHEDGLELELDVSPEAGRALVPGRLLQPLIENAARHGLAGRSDAGRIVVRAERSDGHLELEVTDDGRGLPEDWELEQDRGAGLRALHATLCRRYGDDHALRVGNRREGSGTRVRIRIPFRGA